MNVKTHVFKKELQEYVPTQLDDRLRIETIIYVELSIVDQVDGSLVRNYDYVRLPKELFFTQPDKEMTAEEMVSKRILNVEASLQCPSNNWQVETEACVRCARRMSAKLEQNESRVRVYFFNDSLVNASSQPLLFLCIVLIPELPFLPLSNIDHPYDPRAVSCREWRCVGQFQKWGGQPPVQS